MQTHAVTIPERGPFAAWRRRAIETVAQGYREERPFFDVFSYFDGEVEAWGYFASRSGRVVRRFRVAIQGRVDGDILTLNESFAYSDGTTSSRVWSIRKTGEHSYVGTAGDVIGTADGVAYGNALHWEYTLALDVGGRSYAVEFDDWMYLQDGGTLLNKSLVSKFGIRVGEVILAFSRRPAPGR